MLRANGTQTQTHIHSLSLSVCKKRHTIRKKPMHWSTVYGPRIHSCTECIVCIGHCSQSWNRRFRFCYKRTQSCLPYFFSIEFSSLIMVCCVSDWAAVGLWGCATGFLRTCFAITISKSSYFVHWLQIKVKKKKSTEN